LKRKYLGAILPIFPWIRLYRELGINLAVDDADNSPATVDNKILWTNDAAIETNPD